MEIDDHTMEVSSKQNDAEKKSPASHSESIQSQKSPVTNFQKVTSETDNLMMPHEDLDRPQSKIAFRDRLRYYKQLAVDLTRMRFSNYERKIDICQSLFNGENAGTIHKKFEFIERARKLGYRGPEQVMYQPGQAQQFELALGLFDKYQTVLCKPKDGQQGEGIFLCETRSKLQEQLTELKEPYIVQEYIPPLQDYRYVYHVGTDVTYRFCYTKTRPLVYGNGRDTLAQLIENEPDIPNTSKEKLTKYLRASQLARVPNKDEKVELIDTGNISKGAYGQIITGDELAALDKVMLQLIEDLKRHYNIELTNYCFDIGVLKQDLTPETVSKTDFVFYEYQIPFGLQGYLNSVEVKENKQQVAKLFMNSIMRSWIARQKNELPQFGSEQANSLS